MTPFRLIPPRATPIVFFAIAILISVSFVSLNRAVDKSNQGEVLLTSVRALAYKISAAEWKIISEKTVDEETEQNLDIARTEIIQTLEKALALNPQNADLLSASATLGEYLKWLDEEIRFIKSGDVGEAIRIDSEEVDPTFERLDESLTSAQTIFIRRAEQIRLATNIGSVIFILAASILIAALWSNNQQAWAKIIQANIEQEASNQAVKHSEELATYAEALNRRNSQLKTSSYITRQAAEIQDISELINTVANLIAERFDYSHVGLYILDERKKIAFLQAASSKVGKTLIEQGFSVEINKLNAFKLVVEQGRSYFINNNADAAWAKDANFPLTQSQMVLPMIVRNDTIGVLDLHSNMPQAFDTQDAEILRALSDLVAISFENARLINETKKLVNQLEINTSFQARETWTKFTSRHKPAYQYTPAGVRPLFSNTKLENADGLHIPLILHGQNIGRIVLKRKGATAAWSKGERMLVEKVADQVALALENSRLVDETQKNAMRNQVIANISMRVRETLDVESVIRTATTEFRRVFDLKEVEISIGSNQAEASPVRKNISSIRSK